MQTKNDSVLKRLRNHANRRLVFEPGIPRHKQLSAYKRYLELENEMLKRSHRKGGSGREICQMRATMIDVVVENLFLAACDETWSHSVLYVCYCNRRLWKRRAKPSQ